MGSRISKITVGALTGLAGLATALAVPVAAHASTTPPWEPDTNASGTLSFYDANGNAVTTGSITDTPLAKYAVGSTELHSGDTSAEIEFAQPNPQSSNTLNWNVAAISATNTNYPVAAGAGVPASISALTSSNPVYTGSADDTSLQNDIAGLPNTGPSGDSFDGSKGCAYQSSPTAYSDCTNTSYQNLYQIRLVTVGSGGTTIAYDDADISVDPATGVWTQVYPAPTAAANTTSTTLATDPMTSASQGTSVTLTATISASDATHPAGTVQFKDGTTALGAPVAVAAGDTTASTSTSALKPGTHSLTATFSATDTADYSPSTSDPVSLLVNPVATKPTISGTVKVGHTVTCNEATVLGETVAYQWKLGSTKAGGGRTLALGGAAGGKTLTCTVTLSVSGGTPSSATSAGKKVALGAALKATKKPTLSGTGKAGKSESVKPGKWSPAATKYTYQWLLNGKAIAHATKASYKIPSKDKGKKLSCKVTAHKTGYANGSATSSSIKVKK